MVVAALLVVDAVWFGFGPVYVALGCHVYYSLCFGMMSVVSVAECVVSVAWSPGGPRWYRLGQWCMVFASSALVLSCS